jgi:DNA-binding NarL/FixJ family response regulator
MSAAEHTPQRPAILIVEDRAVMRAMLREFVQKAFPDYTIMDAHNGARGMALCMEHRPQIVLMDVRLPDANGIELTRVLTATAPYIPVIVLSYLASQAIVDAALAAGATAFVEKDRLVSELIPAMTSVLKPDLPR